MAKVSLRIYNREIETLIDSNQLDEAIAHCRHILQTYSKHLETYRLLGKSYLESKRYDEAVDVFSRVLMSVPDDFVSHVGMSIIRDEQNKLDDAIWHMERAFEAQPSNAAIQGELQRLFGRRDGMEPPKIRMTRGALAHMYVQGELFPQAISEIKAVLANDPERDDMKALLARAYFHAGQKADASDICSQLLQRYPYSLDGNRIMVELLQGSDKIEDREVYRDRVTELDPYAPHAQGSVFRSNEAADNAVSLERLEYRADMAPLPSEWNAPGISAGTSASAEQPDWLKTGYSEDLSSTPVPAPEAQSDIPDFLRAAGWEESTGAAEEPAPLGDLAGIGDEAEIAPGEMPDWLKSMAPAGAEEAVVESSSGMEGDNWLDELRSSTPADAKEADVPDWLSGMEASEPEAAPSSSEESIPDWLTPAAGAVAVVPEGFEPLKPEPPAPVAPTATPPPAASIDSLGTSAQEQDDAMAWLESLATKHGAKSEELVTDPSARTDKPPEWVEQAMSLGESKPIIPEPEPGGEPVIPPFSERELLITEPGDLRESFDFLEPEEPAEQKEPEPLEASLDETGIWLKGLEDKQAEAEPLEPSLDETGIWLKGQEEKPPQAAQQDETENPNIFAAETPSAGIADWMTEPGEPAPSQEDIAEEPLRAEELPAEASDLPDWLRGLDEEEGKLPVTASLNESLPGWLQAEPEPEPAPDAEPTSPADWHPIDLAPEPELTREEMEAVPEPAQDYLTDEQERRDLDLEPGPEEIEPELRQEAQVEPPREQPAPRRETTRPAPEKQVSSPTTPRRPTARPATPERRPVQAPSLEGDPALAQAQNDINRGNIPAALEQYSRLIKRGKFLEEIIRDLRDALYRYPVEVTIWQTLGDAYMRENRLQEALDSYTKAEELLR